MEALLHLDHKGESIVFLVLGMAPRKAGGMPNCFEMSSAPPGSGRFPCLPGVFYLDFSF